LYVEVDTGWYDEGDEGYGADDEEWYDGAEGAAEGDYAPEGEGNGYWQQQQQLGGDQGTQEGQQEVQQWQQEQAQQQLQRQPYQQLYYQQLEQQQAALLAEWQQQPGLPMHHYWLTGAHGRAAQVGGLMLLQPAVAQVGIGTMFWTPALHVGDHAGSTPGPVGSSKRTIIANDLVDVVHTHSDIEHVSLPLFCARCVRKVMTAPTWWMPAPGCLVLLYAHNSAWAKTSHVDSVASVLFLLLRCDML
jgi:hypothetical protein